MAISVLIAFGTLRRGARDPASLHRANPTEGGGREFLPAKQDSAGPNPAARSPPAAGHTPEGVRCRGRNCRVAAPTCRVRHRSRARSAVPRPLYPRPRAAGERHDRPVRRRAADAVEATPPQPIQLPRSSSPVPAARAGRRSLPLRSRPGSRRSASAPGRSSRRRAPSRPRGRTPPSSGRSRSSPTRARFATRCAARSDASRSSPRSTATPSSPSTASVRRPRGAPTGCGSSRPAPRPRSATPRSTRRRPSSRSSGASRRARGSRSPSSPLPTRPGRRARSGSSQCGAPRVEQSSAPTGTPSGCSAVRAESRFAQQV